MLLIYCFFFQAEDGIRDLVRSRGLGDVYKRQAKGVEMRCCPRSKPLVSALPAAQVADATEADWAEEYLAPVSYTHLTLPTSDLV